MATALTSLLTRFTDKCNRVLAGGIVKTYEPNSLTPKVSYQDPEGTIPNLPEVVLDETGRAKIYLLGDYRVQVYSNDGVLIEDNLLVEQALVQRDFDNLSTDIQQQVDNVTEQFQTESAAVIQEFQNNSNNTLDEFQTEANDAISKVQSTGGLISVPTLTALQAITSAYANQAAIVEATGAYYRWNAAGTPPSWVATGRNFLTEAAADAQAKADAAQAAAISTAAADASIKATAAQNNATSAANTNTNNKINELKNASVISFDSTAYVNSGYISNNQTGAITTTTNGATRYTNLIEVKKDDVITINNAKVNGVASIAFYGTASNFINSGGLFNGTSSTVLNTPFTVKIQQDGFIRVFNLHATLPGNFTINRPNAPFYGPVNLNTKKIISLNRFYNDEIFQESLKVGSSVFVTGRTANYFTTGTTVQDGYAYRSTPVQAGDLIKVAARMDVGQILAHIERTDGIKTQIIKTGDGIGVLSEFLIEVPTDGILAVNTFIDALNDHSITFYRKEKPYGLGEDRALSYNDYMNNGRYDISVFKNGYFLNTSGVLSTNSLTFLSKPYKLKAGQVANLYQKSSTVGSTVAPITVFDLSMNRIASITGPTLQSNGFYLSTYLATADCYVQFTISNAQLSTNSVDCYFEIPIRQPWDFRARNLYVYGDSQAVLAGISADVSLRWANIIAAKLGYNLTNSSQAGRGMVQSTTSAVPMIQLYNTTDYIKEYQKGDYLVIELGGNDSSTSGGNTPITPAAFKTAYRTVLDYIIKDKKWPASNVKLIGGFWQPSKTQARNDIEAAVKDIAAEYNIQHTNCNDYMARQPDPTALIQSDQLHMTVLGNAVAADWMYSVFNFGRS